MADYKGGDPTWLPSSYQGLASIKGLVFWSSEDLENGLLRMFHLFLGNSDKFLGSVTSRTYDVINHKSLLRVSSVLPISIQCGLACNTDYKGKRNMVLNQSREGLRGVNKQDTIPSRFVKKLYYIIKVPKIYFWRV